MSQADAALRNCINFDQLEDCTLPIQAILQRCSHDQLSMIYKISSFSNYIEFLHRVAVKRGKLRPGGVPDIESAAQVVFYDWNSGKIPYYTIPPEYEFAANRLDATIVSEWSKAFNLNDIMDIESSTVLGELSSQNSEYVTATSIPVPLDAEYNNLNAMEDEDIDYSEDMSDETTPRTKKHPKKNIGQTAIAPLKEKKEPISIKEKPIEEQFNNPSVNQSLRKSTKSMKKEERKSHKTAIQQHQEQNPIVDDKYDFDIDFWQPSNE